MSEGCTRCVGRFFGLMVIFIIGLASCSASTAPLLTPPAPTPTYSSGTPPADCPHYPLGGFNDVWRRQEVWPRLGCAVAPAVPVTGSEAELFCGRSIWLRERNQFILLEGGREQGFVTVEPVPYMLRTCGDCRWSFVDDASGLPADTPLMVWPTPILPTPTIGPPPPTPAPTPSQVPPPQTTLPQPSPTLAPTAGLAPATGAACAPPDIGPISPFQPYFVASGRHGWLACSADWAQKCRGLTRSAEVPFAGAWQQFEGGWLFWNENTVCTVLFADGTWLWF